MSKASENLVRLYVNEKGQCTCGHHYNSDVLWYIGGDIDLILKQIDQEIDQIAQYSCPDGQVVNGIAPLFIDCIDQQQAIIYVPELLAYKSLSIQAELLLLLSREASVEPKSYYTQTEVIVGKQGLSQLGSKVEQSTAIGQGPNVDLSKVSEAPVIAPMPKALQTPILEAAELAQELAESPTQVIKHKSKRSRSNVSHSKANTSSLDALIDTALEDHTAVNDLRQEEFNSQVTDVKERESHAQATQSNRGLPKLQAKPDEESEAQEDKEINKTVISLVEPEEMQDNGPKEQTRRLYAQNMKRFDVKLADQQNKYINVVDGQVELAIKVAERRAESWINEDLDVRIQLHRELQLGAPCLTLFTLKDGNVQDELYWPIHIDGSIGPKALRSLRKSFRFELVLFKSDGQFYGQRVVEAPLEENSAYIINYVKQMGMTSSIAAKARAIISAEDFDREGQMKHPFDQNSFSNIDNAKQAQLAVSIWSYWSTVRQRDYLIFVKSFPIPWLRRLQHRVLKSAIEFGMHMPLNLQSQAVALGLAKSDVELIQKSITHFVEVNLNFRASDLDSVETWENWDALLAQLSKMGIDADEEVEQLAFQAMQKAGVDLEFEDDFEDGTVGEFEDEELTNSESFSQAIKAEEDSSGFESFDDISEINEVSDLEPSDDLKTSDSQDIPPPISPDLDSEFEDDEEAELIMEDFIEEEYLTDVGGDAFLLIDDDDIIEESIVDPKTAEIGEKLSKTGAFEIKTQIFVSQNDEADSDHSSSEG